MKEEIGCSKSAGKVLILIYSVTRHGLGIVGQVFGLIKEQTIARIRNLCPICLSYLIEL
jgi:hypothetical protein